MTTFLRRARTWPLRVWRRWLTEQIVRAQPAALAGFVCDRMVESERRRDHALAWLVFLSFAPVGVLIAVIREVVPHAQPR